MQETPQTFASKAAIIEILKRACGAPLTRREVVEAAARELDTPIRAEVARALEELELDDVVERQVVDGTERVLLSATN